MVAAGHAELAAGRIVAGRYRVEALLGRGGMGRVYRAVDEQLGRAVALKLLALDAATGEAPSEGKRRLLREARAAAAFSHPNAVSLYDVGEFEGVPFIAMELVRGRTLREAGADATVTVADKLRWLGDAARALAAAHRAGLVHRDVKPDNVLVGDDGGVKLLDFGIARRLPGPIDANAVTDQDGTITVEGTLVGTPAYMAPEQLRCERVDGRADQFSWGVMAYELLAGKRPWVTGNAAQLIAAVLSQPAPPLAVAGMPAPTAAAVARALAKLPGDRFTTMDALLDALHATTMPTARRSARPWLVAAAVIATVVVVVAGVALTLRQAPAHTTTGTARSTAPLRRPCTTEESNRAQPCDQVAWCDQAGQFAGCCGKGLVPSGDGICTCPKGGSTQRQDCEAPLHTPSDYISRYLSTVTHRATQHCGAPSDQIGFGLQIDPDGRVLEAEIHGGNVSDVKKQRCVVDALRALEIDPPPDGYAKVMYGADADAPPLRFPCSVEQRKKLPPCNDVAWCDREGRSVGCCAEGLAPGAGGVCACPKGGTTHRKECEPPLHGYMEYQLHYLSPRLERAAARCGSTRGVGYGVRVDPDGRVFDARIVSSKSADATLQRCIIDELRQLELDPPPEGASGVGINPDE